MFASKFQITATMTLSIFSAVVCLAIVIEGGLFATIFGGLLETYQLVGIFLAALNFFSSQNTFLIDNDCRVIIKGTVPAHTK